MRGINSSTPPTPLDPFFPPIFGLHKLGVCRARRHHSSRMAPHSSSTQIEPIVVSWLPRKPREYMEARVFDGFCWGGDLHFTDLRGHIFQALLKTNPQFWMFQEFWCLTTQTDSGFAPPPPPKKKNGASTRVSRPKTTLADSANSHSRSVPPSKNFAKIGVATQNPRDVPE